MTFLCEIDMSPIIQKEDNRTPTKNKASFVEYLSTFPDDVDLDDEAFARNPAPSRGVDIAGCVSPVRSHRDRST
jgi:hypothetical protein